MNGPRASARNDGIMRPKNGEKQSGNHDNLVVMKNIAKELKKSKFSIPFQAMVLNHQSSQELVKMAFVAKDFVDLIKRIPGQDVCKPIRFLKHVHAFWDGYIYFLQFTKESAEWGELDLSTELPEDLESHQQVNYRNRVILFAGIEPQQQVSKVWVIYYSGEVQQSKSLRYGRNGHSVHCEPGE